MSSLDTGISDPHLPEKLDDQAHLSVDFQRTVTKAILCPEPDAADQEVLAFYFGQPRFPGTTSIGYRKRSPEIFQDTTESALETFDDWVGRSIGKILSKMRDKGMLSPGVDLTKEFSRIVEKIHALLSYETHIGVPMAEAIPQQIYEDIFIRIITLLIEGEMPHTHHTQAGTNFYKEFNAIGHRIALALIDRIESGEAMQASIAKIIQLAVLSGYVGINLKSSASAASTLLNRDFIPIKEAWIHSLETVRSVSTKEIDSVVEHLLAVSEQPEGQFGLESLQQYNVEVIECNAPTLLVFFCDDYVESIIDLKRFERMLNMNPNLTVLFIPRNGRYGNDIAYEDMEGILSEAQFRGLGKHLASRRLFISPNGPRTGCIDPRCISRSLIQTIQSLEKGRRVIIETKGCRNFEMLKGGLQVPWYAGFNCNRALSIRTVGVDGPPVFLRIPPGLNAYDRFAQPVIGPSPSYQTARVRFARMTTRQLFIALESPIYRSLLSKASDELGLNKALYELGNELGLPFNELITFLDPQTVKA